MKATKSQLFGILLVIGLLCLAAHTALGGRCPSDKAITKMFEEKRAPIQLIVNMANADGGSVTITAGVVYSDPALPQARKEQYLHVLRQTGALTFSAGGGIATLWYWAHSQGMTVASQEQSKGVTYIAPRAIEYYKRAPKLDGLEHSANYGIYVRPLGRRWFIIYMASR